MIGGWEPGTMAALFLNPLDLPAGARLWMFLPLAVCIATVYRGTRARAVRELPRATAITLLHIVVGMVAIALAAYALHAAALRWF